MNTAHHKKFRYDPWLILAVFSLVGMGIVMVTSASLSFAEVIHKPAWYFASRHVITVVISFILGLLVTAVPLAAWRALCTVLLIGTIALLALLLVPGVTREVNGSLRWLFLGPISIQISEFAKLFLIVYMANYLIKHEQEIQSSLKGFIKPLIILSFVSLLLILEPDFGATVVIVSTILGMLFLGGVPFKRFLVLFLLALITLAVVSVASPYRIQRLTSFLNPWDDQFNTGYQLTQSLIAFGRGGWFGTGLGNSVQKLLYLPEPHTDFIYAVIGEELGLVGALSVLGLFVLLVWRILLLGRKAMLSGDRFGGYISYGIALWFGLQTIINIGVNVGVLPTKGLTLPFMSYGGSSLIVGLMAIGLLLRVEFELRIKKDHIRRSS